MNNPPKISVPIICSNNEDTIGDVLESIKEIAFEIVVIIDTNSNDKTYEIVRQYTDKVTIEPWRGFLDQKNEVLKRCTGDWILSLDSDEVVSPELKNEIIKAVVTPIYKGYLLNRRTVYAGKIMAHVWQPDYCLRLVSRNAGAMWVGESIHETLKANGKTTKLKNYLFHYSYKDVNDHFLRTLKYASGVALNRYKSGKRFNLLKAIVAPPLTFIKQYFLKGGFLDGFRGLIAALSAGFYSFMKQAYLWELEWQKEKKDKCNTTVNFKDVR